MAGLLETVVILWRSIHRSLENNKEARVYTVDKFASVLPQYMRVFTVRRPPGAAGQPPLRRAEPAAAGTRGARPAWWGRAASSLRPSACPGGSGLPLLMACDPVLESSLMCWELRERRLNIQDAPRPGVGPRAAPVRACL